MNNKSTKIQVYKLSKLLKNYSGFLSCQNITMKETHMNWEWLANQKQQIHMPKQSHWNISKFSPNITQSITKWTKITEMNWTSYIWNTSIYD